MAASSWDEQARSLDSKDKLRHLRAHFLIPTRHELASDSLSPRSENDAECTYLCGNSLGLQPRQTRAHLDAYLQTWARKGVYGHFKPLTDSPLPPWLHADDSLKHDLATLVGARDQEVTAMQTLTANLHLAMATFYRPDSKRYKIMIESKAFPSDHYAIESQLRHHGIDPANGLVTISPAAGESTITPDQITSAINEHGDEIAVLVLPAIQYYTGQFLHVKTITAQAQARGITVGWDLAHAIGNVPLHLHDWNVDFAVWCSYKYLNSGPGSIGGLFIHEDQSAKNLDRLAGWWGSSKSTRFDMSNRFDPIPGAAGWQLSNPSVADCSALRASLAVFAQTSMDDLREKSMALTAFMTRCLDEMPGPEAGLFEIITPREPESRGAQLSISLGPGLLNRVMQVLEAEGVVVDERKPDVIRVAPAPLYNSFSDAARFVTVFRQALREAQDLSHDRQESGVDRGRASKGSSEV